MNMGLAATKGQKRKRWSDGEIDADPFGLPAQLAIRPSALLSRAAGFIRYATIYRDAVKATDSSPIFGLFHWSEPLSAFRGIALRVAWRDASGEAPVILVDLLHASDERRTLTLHASFDGADAAARWRAWSQTLGLPLLLEDQDGALREAERRLGSLRIDRPQPHSGANPLSNRRPMSFGATGMPRLFPHRLSAGARPIAYQALGGL